jgi:hypothetical protein
VNTRRGCSFCYFLHLGLYGAVGLGPPASFLLPKGRPFTVDGIHMGLVQRCVVSGTTIRVS